MGHPARINAVQSLISALRFHEVTTETPSEVWIALPRITASG